MRLFFGMILGAFLTVFGAWLHDTTTVSPSIGDNPPAISERAMVNWDVVGENWRKVRQHVHEAWTALSQKINS